MLPEEKPMLDTNAQIEHLKSKGVKFELMEEEAARDYLKQNNNYFKLRAYRKNFPKHPAGRCEGEYINLDFAMLRDLSIIDMRLRYIIIHMALDIEHFAKVKLLKAVEDSSDDGYKIVSDYFMSLRLLDTEDNGSRHAHLLSELNRNRKNPYCGGIIERYDGCYPVWAFVEVIPLGSFIHFYRFCASQLHRKDLEDDTYLLLTIKELRNAAAHNNCILHDMGARDAKYDVNYRVTRALSRISKSARDSKLRNERMRQIATLFYTHASMVPSAGVHSFEREALHEFSERLVRHVDYYRGNDTILTNFAFLQNLIDIFFG